MDNNTWCKVAFKL